MKLIEKAFYSLLLFFGSYTILTLALRYLMTDTYLAHTIAGIVATVLGIGLFMYLLLKKSR